jgi:hypothetical protein
MTLWTVNGKPTIFCIGVQILCVLSIIFIILYLLNMKNNCEGYVNTDNPIKYIAINTCNLVLWLDAQDISSTKIDIINHKPSLVLVDKSNKKTPIELSSKTMTVNFNIPCINISDKQYIKASIPPFTFIDNTVNGCTNKNGNITMFIVYQSNSQSTSTGLISRTSYKNTNIPAPFDIYDRTRFLGDGKDKNAKKQFAALSCVNSTTYGTIYDINNAKVPTLLTINISFNNCTCTWTEYVNSNKQWVCVNSDTDYYDNSNSIYIGARADGYNSFSGNLFEIMIYNLTHNDNDRITIENYLLNKWNITKSSSQPSLQKCTPQTQNQGNTDLPTTIIKVPF